jgi:hypothetical protein
MTTANMKLVVLDVPLDGEMESPDQKLEDGESIVRRTVEMKDLYRVLKGMLYSLAVVALASFDLIMNLSHGTQEYEKKVCKKKNIFLRFLYRRMNAFFSWVRIVSSTRCCCTSLLASTWRNA